MNTKLPYLETLGPFRISHSGRALRISRTKEKALIGFLAVNSGRLFQREYLASLLWSNVNAENAKHSLNNAVYTINRTLPAILTVTPSSISITPSSVWTDINELKSSIKDNELLRHLDLIKGEFLADLGITDAEDFEIWRSDYNRHLFFSIESAIKQELGHLTKSGKRSLRLDLAALAVLSPSLHSLCTDDKDGDHASVADEHAVQSGSRNEFQLPFVGREKQMAMLQSFWTTSMQGFATFVSITGQPGHGKTRLVEEFISRNQSDNFKLLRARSYRSERRIALGPITEMFRGRLETEDIAGVEPIWLAAIHDVMPALPLDMEGAPQLSAVASQSRFYEAVLRLIGSMAKQRPVLIFIDDVQWADESTQALLSFLAHRLSGPVLLLVAERKNTSNHAHSPPWRAWPTITVEELSSKQLEEALERLPHTLNGAAPRVSDLDRLTRGHPYMVTELVRSSITAVRGKDVSIQSFIEVDAFLGSLLSDLPPDAQHVASALSVIGRPTSLNLITKISKASDVTTGLNVLLENGLVDYQGGKASLRHDLVRESTYKRLAPFTRVELHRRVASAIAAKPKRAGETAEHYYRGRDRAKTHTFAIRAAKEADSRHANEESIYFLRMAIRAARNEDTQLQIMLGERLYQTNRTPEAIRQVQLILAMADALSTEEKLTWQMRAFELAYALGEMTGHDLRIELDRLRDKVPTTEVVFLVKTHYLGMQSAIHDGDREYAANAALALKGIADGVDSIDRIRALAPAVRGHSLVTSAREADEWAESLRDELLSIDNPELKINVMAALVLARYAVGQLAEATVFAERVLLEISRVGAMSHWPVNASNAQMLYVEQGRFAEATVLFNELKSRASGYLETLASAGANASIMHYMRGEFVQARDLAVWSQTHLENRKMTWLDLILRGQIGLASLELGDFANAAAHSDYLESTIKDLGTRIIDLSYVEILIARITLLRGQRLKAKERLRAAINDYADRDSCCRMRMELELARILKKDSRIEARTLAKAVFQEARASNAVVIAEGADSLLARL